MQNMERNGKLCFLALVAFSLSGCVQGHTCYAKESHACWCDLVSEGKRINLTLLGDLQISTQSGSHFYTYQPCHSFQCNSQQNDVRVCMYNNNTGKYLGIGRVTNVYHGNPWTVHSLSPLNFTIRYNNGSLSPSVEFTYSLITVVYEENLTEYDFTFLRTQSHDQKLYKSYEFLLQTPHIILEDIPTTHELLSPGAIAGTVVGSWLLSVLVLSVAVIVIIYADIKSYKKKKKREYIYEPIPGPPTVNHPT